MCAVMVHCIMRNISVFRPVVQGEMSFKDIPYLSALMALLLGGAEPFLQFCYRALWEIYCE